MPGLGIVVPRTGGTGPVLPYSIGVAGYAHRWDPNLWTADGAAPATLEDYGSAGVDMAPNGTSGLTAASNAGIGRYVSSFGSSQYLTAGNLTNPAAVSLVAVTKTDKLGSDFFRAKGIQIRRAGSGQWQVGGTSGTVLGASVTGWCLIIGTRAADGAATLYVNGTQTSGTIATAIGNSKAHIGNAGATGTTEVGVALAVVYDRVITPAEAATIRATLRGHFTALP